MIAFIPVYIESLPLLTLTVENSFISVVLHYPKKLSKPLVNKVDIEIKNLTPYVASTQIIYDNNSSKDHFYFDNIGKDYFEFGKEGKFSNILPNSSVRLPLNLFILKSQQENRFFPGFGAKVVLSVQVPAQEFFEKNEKEKQNIFPMFFENLETNNEGLKNVKQSKMFEEIRFSYVDSKNNRKEMPLGGKGTILIPENVISENKLITIHASLKTFVTATRDAKYEALFDPLVTLYIFVIHHWITILTALITIWGIKSQQLGARNETVNRV